MFLKLGLVSFLTFLILDFLWLGFVAKNFYVEHLGRIGRIENGKFQIVMWSGIMVYLLLAAAVAVFVMPLVMQDGGTLVKAIGYGALMGLVAYGVYDFTNYTTLKDYPLVLAFADLAWGTFITAAASVAAFYSYGFFEKA